MLFLGFCFVVGKIRSKHGFEGTNPQLRPRLDWWMSFLFLFRVSFTYGKRITQAWNWNCKSKNEKSSLLIFHRFTISQKKFTIWPKFSFPNSQFAQNSVSKNQAKIQFIRIHNLLKIQFPQIPNLPQIQFPKLPKIQFPKKYNFPKFPIFSLPKFNFPKFTSCPEFTKMFRKPKARKKKNPTVCQQLSFSFTIMMN